MSDLEKVEEVRDFLLPGLAVRNQLHPHLSLNMQIDSSTENLLVTGFNTKNKNTLGFLIPKNSIPGGLYKEVFLHGVDKLVECLNKDPSDIKELP